MQRYLIILLFLLPLTKLSSQTITLEEIKDYVGKPDTIKVCGKIHDGRYLNYVNRSPTLLNVGGSFPSQKLTLVIFEEDRQSFPPNPEKYFINTEVCVRGVVIEYNGKPEIIIRSKEDLEVLSSKAEVTSDVAGEGSPEVRKSVETVPKDNATAANATKLDYNGKVIVNSGEINLRSGPSVDFPVISVIPSGSTIKVIFTRNGWSEVTVKTSSKTKPKLIEGYIKSSALSAK